MFGFGKKVMGKKKKDIIGLSEIVKIIGNNKSKTIRARIDTGADICSIDAKLAKQLNLGPVERVKKIKSAHGIKERPILRARVQIKKRRFANVRFSIADRRHLRYRALIGKNILRNGFLVDPSKR